MNLGFTVYGRLQTVLKFPTGRPSPFLTFLPLRGNERAVHPPQSQFSNVVFFCHLWLCGWCEDHDSSRVSMYACWGRRDVR